MPRHCLYKYYTERRWAEDFLDGKLLFRSLSYFRDYEDTEVREDRNEGTALFRPQGGLVLNNQTQGNTVNLPNHTFRSSVKQEEIFIFCTSRFNSDEIQKRFEAVVYIEIMNIKVFCERIEKALPLGAKFPERAGRSAQIGRHVEYYSESEGGNPRWALPEVIATSKLKSYAWQNEFRLVFSLTDALDFENVSLSIVHESNAREVPKPSEHHHYLVESQPLRDICRLHEV